MNKEEIIQKYGKGAYERIQQQQRNRYINHREEVKEITQLWRFNHPDQAKAHHRESSHKDGKYYKHRQEYQTTGLQGKRNQIRRKHGRHYRPFKRIIASESQIHHEWTPGTAEYRGVALVEKDQHMHGFIDVIQILEGEITLRSEYIEIPMEGVK